MREVSIAAQTYRFRHEQYPPGDNAQIARALVEDGHFTTGDRRFLNERGELVDRWHQPFRFIVTATSFCIISSGQDRQFNTFDDLVYVGLPS